MTPYRDPRSSQRHGPHPPEFGQAREPAGVLYSILRLIGRHVRGFWGALAAYFTVGAAAAAIVAAVFAALAIIVEGGFTQNADERALEWIVQHRTPLLDRVMLDLTTLGDGVVIVMLVVVTSTFLWLTQHRWSVYILIVGVIGGKVLNNALKMVFARPRPTVVEGIDTVSSASFPSGHAMSAMIAYGSVAYLIARLGPTRGLRTTTWAVACLLIVGIGSSRMYLGVHYPSDVIGGFLAGLAWLTFVATNVAAVRYFAPRRPDTAREEQNLHDDVADGPAPGARS